MNQGRKPLRILASILACSLVLTACSGSKSTKGTEAQATGTDSKAGGKQLVVTFADTPPGLDVDQALSNYTEAIAVNVYESFITKFNTKKDTEFNMQMADIFSPGSKGITPGLAESFDVSPDGRSVTYHLRKDAKSFYGNVLTAEDVRWSIERHLFMKGVGKFIFEVQGIKSMDNVKVVDDRTITLTTEKPSPLFFKIDAANFYGMIIDSKEVKKHATNDDPWSTNWLANNTAGFGPYHVQSQEKGRQLVLVANPNYYGTKPVFDKVIWRAVPSSANRLALLTRGDVDIAEELSTEELAKVDGDPKLKAWRYPGNVIFPLVLNLKSKPFDNQFVRQAIASAVPYDDINKKVFDGKAFPSKSIVPKIFPGYAEVYNYTRNVEKAKELLKQGGYPNGFDMTISYDAGQVTHEQAAILIQTALKDIGVNVTLEKLPSAVFSQRGAKKEFQAFINVYWPLIADPGYALWIYIYSDSFLNYGNYDNKQYDQLVLQTTSELDETKRLDAAKKAQEIVATEVPWVLLPTPGYRVAMKADLQNYTWYPDNHVRYVDLKR